MSRSDRGLILRLRNKLFNSSQMSRDFYKLLKDQQLTDIEIISEHKTIGAHKAVLFFASEYFEEFIDDNRKMKTIFMKEDGVTFITIVMALKYIYTGTVNMHYSRMGELLAYIETLKLANNEAEMETVSMGRARRVRLLSTPVDARSGFLSPPLDEDETNIPPDSPFSLLCDSSLSPSSGPPQTSSSELDSDLSQSSADDLDSDDNEDVQINNRKRRLSFSSLQQEVPVPKKPRLSVTCQQCGFTTDEPYDFALHEFFHSTE